MNDDYEPREELSPNGVSHLVIGRRCMTCGDPWRHDEWRKEES